MSFNNATICLLTIFFAQTLFFTGVFRSDLVSILSLICLYLFGIITSSEAISGFSDPALITVACMFIISAALSASGVAAMISKIITKLGNNSYPRLLFLVIIISIIISAFMNNVAVTALMLPVVMEIAKVSNISPSKFLIPMSFAVLIGGTLTIVGTPPNLLVSSILKSHSYPELDFLNILKYSWLPAIWGFIYLIAFSNKLLGSKRSPETISITQNLKINELNKHNYLVEIFSGSKLVNETIANSRIGLALGLNILAINRNNDLIINPNINMKLLEGDQLIANGNTDSILELATWREFKFNLFSLEELTNSAFIMNSYKVKNDSKIISKKLLEISMPETFGIKIIAIKRGNSLIKKLSGSTQILNDDEILCYGKKSNFELFEKTEIFTAISKDLRKNITRFRIHKRIFIFKISEDSGIIDKSVKEINLAKRFNLRILLIKRNNQYILADSKTIIKNNDELVVLGRKHEINVLNALQNIKISLIKRDLSSMLESDKYKLIESTIPENSSHIFKTIKEINFKERYLSQVVGIWRGDQLISSNLANVKINFADNLILLTKKEDIQKLNESNQIIVLNERSSLTPDIKKVITASFSILIMIILIIFKILSLEMAAISTAFFLIVTNCINKEKAYNYIDFKTIILVGATIPYGVAMRNSGATDIIANYITSLSSNHSPFYIISSIYLITMLATVFIPNQAVVLIIAPIALSLGEKLNLNIEYLLQGIAIAASSSFFSPLSHASNLLVMSAGNYSFFDYFKLGIGLAFVVFLGFLIRIY